MVNIPKNFYDFYNKNWFFISKWHNINWDNYNYIISFAKKIGVLIPLENNNIFTKDIKVNINWDLNSPATWNKSLWLHTDSFFREKKYKPKVVILFCIHPWNWTGWKTIFSNIETTIKKYWKIYWEKEKNKLLNTKIYFSKEENIFKYWDLKVKIFQKFVWKYENSEIFKDWFYNICDDLHKSKNLKKFWELLIKNSITFPVLEKGDILVLNNEKYAHWRTWDFWNDRYLIRVQVK